MTKYLLKNIDRSSFFENFYLQTPFKFNASIETPVDWHDINQLLSSHVIDYPRIRICGEDNEMSRGYKGFMKYDISSSNSPIPIVNKHILEWALKSGNTLIIDAAQDFFPALNLICNEISEYFSCSSSANIYAAWVKKHPSFGLHFDDHGVIAYQVEGVKKWFVHNPTYKNPLSGDKSFLFQKPIGDPDYEFTLEAGEAIYVPSGFWHNVFLESERSLHISFTINRPRISDVLLKTIKLLSKNEFFRQELPLTESDFDLAQFEKQLFDHLRMQDFRNWFRIVNKSITLPKYQNDINLPNFD